MNICNQCGEPLDHLTGERRKGGRGGERAERLRGCCGNCQMLGAKIQTSSMIMTSLVADEFSRIESARPLFSLSLFVHREKPLCFVRGLACRVWDARTKISTKKISWLSILSSFVSTISGREDRK